MNFYKCPQINSKIPRDSIEKEKEIEVTKARFQKFEKKTFKNSNIAIQSSNNLIFIFLTHCHKSK